jgi:hypothetical protein
MSGNYCLHQGEGYFAITETHWGEYKVWTCGDCGLEVPIDKDEQNPVSGPDSLAATF